MTQVIVERMETEAIVKPGGDVVAARADEIRAALRGAVHEGARQLTLDLAGVSMVDSTGLGLMIAAHNSLRKVGGHFAIRHASADIFDLLRSMRMHQHFSVSSDEAGAK